MSVGCLSLCEDVKHIFMMLPEALCYIYHVAGVKDENEALVVVLHTLMLETGFIPQGIPEEKKDGTMPAGWNKSDIYKINYTHKSCVNVASQVTFVPLGAAVAVHGTIIDNESDNGVSCVLTVRDFIRDREGFADPKCVYHNLPKLSQCFKDTFSYALLVEMQYACGLGPSFGLAALPIDIKFHLLSYLTAASLVAMSAVNKEFEHLANSSFLWKKLFLRDFPDDVPEDTSEQHKWKELYKEVFARRNAWRKQTPSWPPLPQPSSSHPPFPPFSSGRIYRGIELPPELQEAFPYLGRRFRSENPILRHILSRNPHHPLFRFL